MPTECLACRQVAIDEALDPRLVVSVTLIPRSDTPGVYGPGVHVFLADESDAERAAALAAGRWTEEGDEPDVTRPADGVTQR